MKTKNGFTLLELLAVIVVLAIIALIVTPFIATAIKEAKKGSFSDSAYGMIRTAELYYMNKLTDHDYSSTLITINESVINEVNFNYEGQRIDTLYLEINDKGKTNMYMWNDGFCATKTFLEQEITVTEMSREKCNLIGPPAPEIDGNSVECVANNKTLSIVNALPNAQYQYYVSTSNIILQNGSWLDINDNSIVIADEGIHYVYFRGIEDNVIGAISQPIEVCIDNREYNVIIEEVTGGSVTATPTKGQIGTQLTFNETINTGYELNSIIVKDIEDNLINITATKNFNMRQGGLTITPSFRKIDYSVTLTQLTGGTISATKTTANYGDEITITTTPNTGYRLKTLKVGTTDITSTKKFTMPNNSVTVSVVWEKISYTITLTQATGGKITSNKTTANYGNQITITTTPDAGYSLKTLTYNSIDFKSTKKFTMPASNVEVKVTWNLDARFMKKTRTQIGTTPCNWKCDTADRTCVKTSCKICGGTNGTPSGLQCYYSIAYRCVACGKYFYDLNGLNCGAACNSSNERYATDAGVYGDNCSSYNYSCSCPTNYTWNGSKCEYCYNSSTCPDYSDWSEEIPVYDCTESDTVSCTPI